MVKAGIDLGAQSIRLVISGEGLVFEEPAAVAFNEKGNVLAIGSQALELRGCKDEKIRLVYPIHADDEQIDLEALEAMLNELCYEFRLFRLFQKTALVLCYPSRFDQNVIERLENSLGALGANEMYFDQEVWMAAIGSGLDLFLPVASCVLSLGYSNCDLAVFAQGRIVRMESNQALTGSCAAQRVKEWIFRQYGAHIEDSSLDALMQTLGSVRLSPDDRAMKVEAVHEDTGQKIPLTIRENEIAAILSPFAREAGIWVSNFIEGLDRNQKADLRERGIVACGGAMKLSGLASQISTLCDVPVYIADEPEHTAAKGLEILLDNLASN